MITALKDIFHPPHPKLAIPLTIVIAIALLSTVSFDSADASFNIPRSGIDISGPLGTTGTPEGVWSDGSTIWVVDNANGKLVAFSLSNGDHLADKTIELDSSNGKPRGIWSNNYTIWVSDWDDTKLYAYNLNNGSRQANKDIDLAGSNDAPRGIAGQYNAILVVDKDDTYVYAYSQYDGSRRRDVEFDLHGSNDHPWGIWIHGFGNAWVSDLNDDMLYGYGVSTGDHDPAADVRLPGNNLSARGIWSDGETMWVVDEEDQYLYGIYYRHFRHTNDEIDISAVDAPRGIWTDGETMWVVDGDASPGRKLLAYRLSDGARQSGKDTVLNSANRQPRGIWSNGTNVWVHDSADHTIYAYVLGSNDGERQTDVEVQLPQDFDDPKGIWGEGGFVWVARPNTTTLTAFSLDTGNSDSDRSIELDPGNLNAGGVWSDGDTIWVLDTADAHVYAYDLKYSDSDYDNAQVYRERSAEFRPSPHNERFGVGFTGHNLRFWVADNDDDLLYAYARPNTPASFPTSTTELQVHHTIAGASYVGTVPAATDDDGDTLSYGIGGSDVGKFTFDRQTREIYTAADVQGFPKGKRLSLTVFVSDGKSRLDGVDHRSDDAIGITVRVLENSDPTITTPDSTLFTIDENVPGSTVIGEIEATDPDGDQLDYSVKFNGYNLHNKPFKMDGNQLKIKRAGWLDYEYFHTYPLVVFVSDGKDNNGDPDDAVDDQVHFTVKVNNVNEPGYITMNHAQPDVGTEIVASLRDPDGIFVYGVTEVEWVVEKSANASSGPWTELTSAITTTHTLGYTPVAADADHFLRFTATYQDNQDRSVDRTVQEVSENAVAAVSATNHSPTFDDGSATTRDVAEDAAGGSEVGSAVSASDSDMDDTLNYGLDGADAGAFSVNASTGQISLGSDTVLDHETRDSYSVTVQVSDSKDADGNADTAWDAYIAVTINVTNVDEDGEVTLSMTVPEENVEISATMIDPDGGASNLSWQWQRADSISCNTSWMAISGANADHYTPVAVDVGKFLRAQVSYDDAAGTGKQAASQANSSVMQAFNVSPAFDEGATAIRSVDEGASVGAPVGAAVTATDPDGDDLTYSIADGAGSNWFVIDPATGEIMVSTGQLLDYEANPSFTLTVQVSDNKDASHSPDDVIDDAIAVTVNLVNVDEPGVVRLDSTEPEVGSEITASLEDPDGNLSSLRWQWSRSEDGATNWEDIAGASTSSYTPDADDEGLYLRAVVDYTDAEGSGKSADATGSQPVPASGDDGVVDLTSTEDPDGPQDSEPLNPPTFYEACRQDKDAGLVVDCGRNEFAAFRILADGSYTISWAEWDAAHPDVTGYDIGLNEFVYAFYYLDGESLNYNDLVDVYQSCEFVDDRWNCRGTLDSNIQEHMDGTPSEGRMLAEGVDLTEWTSALEAPGRWVSNPTFYRWSGDATDPDNEPTQVTLRVEKIEMDLYQFQPQGVSGQRGAVLVHGANGFGDRP